MSRVLRRVLKQLDSLGTLQCRSRNRVSCVHGQYFIKSRLYSSKPIPKEDADSVSDSSIREPVEDIPWYLRDPDASKGQQSTLMTATIPDMPDNSPSGLEPLMQQMAGDLGLDDLDIIDLRHVNPGTSLGPNTIIILGSGKSERHLIKATLGLAKWIKQEYNIIVDKDGIRTSNYIRLQQRRLKRKAQRKYFVGSIRDEVTGKADSWIVLDTKMDGMFVHLFTPERRSELSLESLWKDEFLKPSDEGLSQNERIASKFDKLYKIPSGVRGFHTFAPRRSFLSEQILKPHSDEGDYRLCISLSRDKNIKDEEGLILKAHINHIKNLQSSANQGYIPPLTRNSPVFVSFMNAFPKLPEPFHWKLLLIFLQSCHASNPQEFPLQVFIDHLIFQQASGIPATIWDVEIIISTIAYSNQRLTVQKQPRRWTYECDEKFRLILQVMEIACRSTGQLFSASSTLLALTYRLCINPTKEYITYDRAIDNPTPSRAIRRGNLDGRAIPIYNILGRDISDENKSKTLLALAMTALANDLQWHRFWLLVNDIISTRAIDKTFLLFMVSLVIKASDKDAIIQLIDHFLPRILMDTGNTTYGQEAGFSTKLFTPQLANALKQGLDYINPNKDGYKVLRNYIHQVESKPSSNTL